MKNTIKSILAAVLVTVALTAGHTTAWATVTGSGTEGDPYVVDSWADLKEKMAAGGYIRLGANVSDPTKSSSSYLSVPSGVTVTLDLAGHTIDRALTATTSNGYVINLVGTLTINDSSSPSTGTITGGWTSSGYGGCVYTNNGSSLTLNGGTISGNKVEKSSGEAKGGAVYVTVNATFTMNGGAITGNSVSTSGGAWGGGVCVHGWSSGVGTFNMNGGTISGNSVTGSATNSKGGGVYYYSGGHFNLKGNCTITGNTCNDVANNVRAESPINITGALDASTRIGLTAAVETQLTSNNIATYGSVTNFTSDLPIYAPEVHDGYIRLVAVGEFVAAREATCTETGISQDCWLKDGHYYSDQACTDEINPVIPALGHDMTHHDAVAATATTFGNVEYWTCSRCGKYFSDANGDTETTAESVRILPTSVTTVSYVDAGGTEHTADAIPLPESMTTLESGIYVVNSNVNFTGTVTLAGDVTLILADGCTMSIGTEDDPLDVGGIDSPYNLTIYGQGLGTGYLKIYCAAYYGIRMGSDKAYTQHSGNVLIVHHGEPCIYQGNITLDGGTLDVESEGAGDGDIYAQTISILGGQLHARNKGLYADDGITLGCANAGDVIYATGYHNSSVTVADDRALGYVSNSEKHILIGTLTSAQISDIAGKELTKAMSWADLNTLMAAGGTRTVTLTNDVTRPAAGGISVTGTVTLDLNGYTIDGNRQLNPIFFVTDGVSLTITDSQTGGNLCQGGQNPTVGVYEGGSLTLAAGTINPQASGVSVYKGSFTMTGGAITGGTSAGVWLSDGGSFTMSGGTITGAEDYGVRIDANAAFTMTGGSITSNGVGVGMDDKTATFTVSGNANITGNTTSDVYLYGYYDSDLNENVFTPVTIGGALATTARIGINIEDYYANYITGDAVKTVTSGLSGNGTRQNFVLNGLAGHALVIDGSGELAITTGATINNAPETTVLSESKYVTTFYNDTQDYRLLDGAKAYTVNLDGDKLVFHLIGVDGSVIPHGNAVVIVSESGSITLTKLASTDVTVYGGNILDGSDTDVTVTAGKVEGKTPYVLNISGGDLGFYKFGGSTIPAGKAYYLKSE